MTVTRFARTAPIVAQSPHIWQKIGGGKGRSYGTVLRFDCRQVQG